MISSFDIYFQGWFLYKQICIFFFIPSNTCKKFGCFQSKMCCAIVLFASREGRQQLQFPLILLSPDHKRSSHYLGTTALLSRYNGIIQSAISCQPVSQNSTITSRLVNDTLNIACLKCVWKCGNMVFLLLSQNT